MSGRTVGMRERRTSRTAETVTADPPVPDLVTIERQLERWPAALAAIREARGCIELLGKLAGQLQTAPTINVIMSAEWQELQTLILAALEPYRDARLAVASALMMEGHA